MSDLALENEQLRSERDLLRRRLAAVEETFLRTVQESQEEILAMNDALARTNARLRELDQMKDAFLSMVTHELRTPLTVISGITEMLETGIYGEMTSDHAEHIRQIGAQSARLRHLVNDLLDLSKIEAGRMVLRLEPVELDEVVDDALRLCRPLAREAKVSLSCEIETVPAMLGDRQALYQIMVNLLSNAIKFTPGGGEVLVKLVRTTAGAEISVRDTGIGIAADDIPRVLQPYAQADSQVARKHKGTGLGLPLARQLAGLHEAEFRLDSEVGRGTSVVVAFPQRRFAADKPRDPTKAQAG